MCGDCEVGVVQRARRRGRMEVRDRMRRRASHSSACFSPAAHSEQQQSERGGEPACQTSDSGTRARCWCCCVTTEAASALFPVAHSLAMRPLFPPHARLRARFSHSPLVATRTQCACRRFSSASDAILTLVGGCVALAAGAERGGGKKAAFALDQPPFKPRRQGTIMATQR